MSENKPKNFNSSSKLPKSQEDSSQWQDANRSWWQKNPMRYDWKEQIPYEEFSKEFYEEIDKRFLNMCSSEILRDLPLEGKRVLEIGVGNGSHAGVISKRAKFYTGIDITDYAVKSASRRLGIFNLKGDIKKMDAENMNFPDNSFDLIWSWGVVHHSSSTENVLKEMQRVLKPGGRAVVMVYHRGWWNYYIMETLWGIFSGVLLKTKSLHKTVQEHTDGAIARYYTIPGWNRFAGRFLNVEKTEIRGFDADIILLPAGKLKSIVSKLFPEFLTKFLTHNLKMGSFLISYMSKEKEDL